MRKRRVIIISKDPHLQKEVTGFFEDRGYATAVFRDSSICSVYDSGNCTGPRSCGDVMLMNADTPQSGLDLIAAQNKRGCKLPAANKAIIAGSLPDIGLGAAFSSLGVAVFLTPLDFGKLQQWVAECETRMDLERSVAIRRREVRHEAHSERISYYLPGNRLGRATIVNKSACGVCFTTSHHLTTNDMIMLRPVPQGISEDAVVCWVRPAEKNRYIVGINFCV